MPTYARTVAFATWMFGHIFLAFNFRSEQTPLLKQGVLSNKVMLLWALLVVVVLVVGTNIVIHSRCVADYKLKPATIGRWLSASRLLQHSGWSLEKFSEKALKDSKRFL